MLSGLFIGLSNVFYSLEGILDGLNVGMKDLFWVLGISQVEVVGTGDTLSFLIGEIAVQVRGAILVFLFRHDALVGVVL